MPQSAAKPTDVRALRRELRARRASLDLSTQRAHAIAATRHLLASGIVLVGRNVGLYDATNGELETDLLIDRLLAMRREVALPVIQGNGLMDFYRIDRSTPFRPNRHGIFEPDALHARYAHPLSIDLVFVPLVGFDRSGHRLGMGGGYYDRFFSRAEHRPLLIGLAHALQQVEALPRASWDVPLDAVVTEGGLQVFSPRARRFGNR